MSVIRPLFLIGSMLLVACTPKEGVAADSTLRGELEMLTGSNARECGFVALDQDPIFPWECARIADEQNIPYWIAIERSGIDSDVWIAGLRTPAGVRYVLTYDSNYLGGAGLLPRFSREACEGQLVLDMERQKIIQCLRSSRTRR